MINPSSGFSHTVTSLLEVNADTAFAFMSDPVALGGWSLGCMNTHAAEHDGVYTGTSLFDGATGHFAIDADPERMIIDYRLGRPEQMVPRISARIIAAGICGLKPEQCYVTLTAWRDTGMDDGRWHRLCVSHEAEILLIKAQCENRQSPGLAQT